MPTNDEQLDRDFAVFGMTKCAAGYQLGSYELPDETICNVIEQIKTDIQSLVIYFLPVHEHEDPDILQDLLVPENSHLVRYMGFLAQGGPTGEQGWRNVVCGHGETCSRNAIIYGIIGSVLKEHIFSELFVGAPPDFTNTLARMEREGVEKDGLFHPFNSPRLYTKKKTNYCRLLPTNPTRSAHSIILHAPLPDNLQRTYRPPHPSTRKPAHPPLVPRPTPVLQSMGPASRSTQYSQEGHGLESLAARFSYRSLSLHGRLQRRNFRSD